MSLMSLLDPEKEVQKTKTQFSDGLESPSAIELFKAQRREDIYNFNTDAEFNSYKKAVTDITENELKFDKEKESLLSEKEQELRKKFRSFTLRANSGITMATEAQKTMKELRELRPDLNLPDLKERAHKVALEAKRENEALRERNDSTLGTVAGFAGSFAASAQDPIDVMMAFLPIAKATSIGRAFMMGFAENAGTEVLKIPTISKWQKELGEKYGVREATTQVMAAGLFGGAFSGGGKAVSNILEKRAAKSVAKKITKNIVEETNPEKPIDLGGEGLPKLSEALEEVAANEKIPQEQREAFAILAKHHKDLENKPDFVSGEAHLKVISEINNAMEKGDFPDMDIINAHIGEIKNIDSASRIKTDLKDSLVRAGRSEKEAIANAELHVSALESFSKRTGRSIEELNTKYGPEVDRGKINDFYNKRLQKDIELPGEVRPVEGKVFVGDLKGLNKSVIDELSGTNAVNAHTGWKVKFSKAGLKKTSYKNASKANQDAFLNMKELLERAVYVEKQLAKNANDADVKAIHKFYSKLRTENGESIVKITVRETREGLHFYDKFSIENKKNATVARGSQIQRPEVASRPRAAQSISDFMEEVNILRSENPHFQAGKGLISLDGDEGVSIKLFKDANASTMVHETGHLYLKMLNDLYDDSPNIKQDMDSLLDWFGVKSRKDITIDHHEMFARGFEKYLREGVAPTPKLQRVFNQFKDWLKNIYKKADELNVEINDNVRGVYDRIIAFEEKMAKENKVDSDIIFPKMSQEKPKNLFEISEYKGKTARSNESFSKAKETLREIAESNPDEVVELNGKKMKMKDFIGKVEENENLLKALDVCEVS